MSLGAIRPVADRPSRSVNVLEILQGVNSMFAQLDPYTQKYATYGQVALNEKDCVLAYPKKTAGRSVAL